MARITTPAIAQAHLGVQRMSLAQKVALPDEIFKEQPTLLASILVLPRMGVAMAQLDVAIHVLLVAFQAMKRSGHGGQFRCEMRQAPGVRSGTWRSRRWGELRRTLRDHAGLSLNGSDPLFMWSAVASTPA